MSNENRSVIERKPRRVTPGYLESDMSKIRTGKIPHNRPTYKGNTYDSDLELAYYQRLELYKKSKNIEMFIYHPKKIILAESQYGELGWKTDFFVRDKNDKPFFIEVKGSYAITSTIKRKRGFRDPTYRLKLNLYRILQDTLPPLLVLVGVQKRGCYSFSPIAKIGMDDIGFEG